MHLFTRTSRTPATAPKLDTRAGGGSVIRGYAAVYYSPNDPGSEYQLADDVFERIRPSAFDRALRERDDVRALFNHDTNLVLGRTSAGTLRLSVDSRGLRYEIDPPDTQLGRDLAVSLRREDVSVSSFQFSIDKEDFRREGGKYVRELVSVRLFDVGPVTFPAYPSASSGVSGTDAGRSKSREKANADLIAVELALLDGDHLV